METHDSPQTLVQRARQGERAAFDSLVRAFEAEVRTHANRRIGAHLKATVEVADVIQETFSRAWKAIDNFRWAGERAFAAWLKGIAEHVILKLVDRHGRDRVIYRQEETGSDEPSPSKALRQDERFDRLEDALAQLSPDYREAVRLVRIEGLQIKDAAERMNRSPKAVMHLVSRGLQQLRQNFGDTESLSLPARRFRTGGDEDEQA